MSSNSVSKNKHAFDASTRSILKPWKQLEKTVTMPLTSLPLASMRRRPGLLSNAKTTMNTISQAAIKPTILSELF
eukprot:6468304-Amphidinium_carterae.1